MTNPADGTPLTRRQIRELAEATQAPDVPSTAQGAQPLARSTAQAAPVRRPSTAPAVRETVQPQRSATLAPAQPLARSAGPLAGGSQPPVARDPAVMSRRPPADRPDRGIPAGVGTGRVVAAPGVPAQQSSSRVEQARSQQSGAVEQPTVSRRSLREPADPPAAVIVPPRQTGKVRTVDETGELSAMRAVGAIPPSAVPPRQTSPAPVASAPVRRSSVGTQPQTEFPAAGRPGTVPPAQVPTRAVDPALPPQSWQQTGIDENPWSAVVTGAGPVTPASAVTAAGFPQRSPVARDMKDTQVGGMAALAAGDARPTAPPAWDAITVGDPVADEHDLQEDVIEDEPEFLEPNHKYTWLHYLILIAVAFVLGLILWKVALENRGAEGLPGPTGQTNAAEYPGSSLIDDVL